MSLREMSARRNNAADTPRSLEMFDLTNGYVSLALSFAAAILISVGAIAAVDYLSVGLVV
ncbi:MAG: hypothetical protein Tsb0010_07860 [Parvularculaceae bacterium]